MLMLVKSNVRDGFLPKNIIKFMPYVHNGNIN
jgi:hypothetical protein